MVNKKIINLLEEATNHIWEARGILADVAKGLEKKTKQLQKEGEQMKKEM